MGVSTEAGMKVVQVKSAVVVNMEAIIRVVLEKSVLVGCIGQNNKIKPLTSSSTGKNTRYARIFPVS